MLERPLRYAAIILSFFVVAGFGLFAIDDAGRASAESRDRVAARESAAPALAGEPAREQRNSQAREWIDDVNDVVLDPFAGLVNSDSQWVQRGVPALIGLMLYGFMLAYMARFARGWG